MDETKPVASRSVLLERDVALLTSSSVVSATGTGAMFVALPFYAYATTGSVVLTALVTLAEYAPAVGVAQLAGVLVDRSDARRVLVAANAALGLCTLAYLLHDNWWWLTVVAFVRSSIAQLVAPATHTLLPAVAPPGRLTEVNGVLAVGGNAARLAGPALGGVLVGVGGLALVAVVDAASFVLAAGLVVVVRRAMSTTRPRTAEGVVRQWVRGWAAVREHPVLRPLVVVMAIIGFGEGFVSALLAPWMSQVADGGSAALGLMLSLQALGGILGGLFVVRFAGRWPALLLIGAGALGSGVLLVVMLNYPLVAPAGPWPAIVLNAIAGFPFAVYATAQAVAVQTHSVDGQRGRIVSATYGIQGIAQLAGISLAGPAAALLGPLIINVDTGAYLLAGALALQTLRSLHRSPTGRPAGVAQEGG
ncbi:MFS transporter [Microlunatus sagamiharensis]|uniref:MFS transporter n=1 Tax=Microlunatus sagamiharensis TaxID=546874 RepID=UPI0012FDA000|nr:MFS transporter [Microlunatus sagamiharensis]